MTKKPILVFDLDGTLVETKEDLLDCLNFCLKKQGIEAISLSSLAQYIGHGGEAMIRHALQEAGREEDPVLIKQMMLDFYNHYAENIPGKSHYFNGLLPALQRLRAHGFIFAICTNKMIGLAEKLIPALNKQAGIDNPFAAICGGDSFSWKKPDGRHILSTIEAAGGDPKRAIMVGDSAPDMGAAHNAGVPSIAVSFGYSDVPIASLKPSIIINSYDELTPALVDKLLVAKH